MVALKVIDKLQIQRAGMERAIAREIHIQSCLSHKNILPLYGFFHDDTSIYLILEYSHMGELYQWVKKQPLGRLSEEQASTVIRQVLRAFIYM